MRRIIMVVAGDAVARRLAAWGPPGRGRERVVD
jgi:hypothetical protein